MHDIIHDIENWSSEGKGFVIGTVVRTWGSAPRKMGANMAIREDGKISGSVSGGCVENDVVSNALEAMRTGQNRVMHYGVSDETAWTVGLSCGGKIDVLLEPFQNREILHSLITDIEHDKGGVLVRSFRDPDKTKYFSGKDLLDSVDIDPAVLDSFSKRIHRLVGEGEDQSMIQVIPRNSKLLIIGAAHLTVDLVHLARPFGFESTVIDPRKFFTDNTQFKTAPKDIILDWPAEVLQDYPVDPYTYVVILSHDPKIDDQAIELLIDSNVAYIGALGSRKTHEKRKARLKEKGLSEDQINKIHAPIGVDINAQSAKEIALSILGELVKVKNQYI